jgi:hypothetical protein
VLKGHSHPISSVRYSFESAVCVCVCKCLLTSCASCR